jgi:anthranilate phosphoribosyltransferase
VRAAIAEASERRELSPETVERVMDAMLRGEASAAQIAALLVALRMKGETATEIAAAARAMRRHAVPVHVTAKGPIVDTCGTGGNAFDSFNISTAAALVVAGTGVTVAKHGNRAATSTCGSADVLEALGVDLSWSPERIGRCIDAVGIGYLFARAHHPAMKHVAPVRAELPLRTMFNLLGPLTNPAGATHQLLGVGDPQRLELMADVLGRVGVQGAWVVYGEGGLDDVSIAGTTRVAELREGRVRTFELRPEDFGVPAAPIDALRGGDAARNAEIVRAILAGERGPRRDVVVINAAAALCAAGVEREPRAAAERAQRAIDDGSAAAKLAAWTTFSG